MIDPKVQEQIDHFKKRIGDEPEFCEHLYRYATIRLLAHKYAYYVKSNSYVEDITYDLEEKGWYVMGRALGHLKEDETSPCVDFDYDHPLAKEGIELAERLMR